MNKSSEHITKDFKSYPSLRRVSKWVSIWLACGVAIVFGLIALGAVSLFDLAERSEEETSNQLMTEIRVAQNIEKLINLGDRLVNAQERDMWWNAGVVMQALSYHPSLDVIPQAKEQIQVTYQVASLIMRQRNHEEELKKEGKTQLVEVIQSEYHSHWKDQKQKLEDSVELLTIAMVGRVGDISKEITNEARNIVILSSIGGIVGFFVMLVLYLAAKKHILKPMQFVSKALNQVRVQDSEEVIFPPPKNQEVYEIYAAMGELSQMRLSLEKLALYDRLSGLGNKNLFDELLPRWIANANRNQQNMAVLFMDLDGFKAINDQHGHDVGNDVLRTIGMRLSDFSRGNDLYFRIGGDEFAALLYLNEDIHLNAEKISNKIISLVEEPISYGPNHLSVSISIGISFYPEDSEEGESLVTIADRNMYAAKRHGLGFVPKQQHQNDNVVEMNIKDVKPN